MFSPLLGDSKPRPSEWQARLITTRPRLHKTKTTFNKGNTTWGIIYSITCRKGHFSGHVTRYFYILAATLGLLDNISFYPKHMHGGTIWMVSISLIHVNNIAKKIPCKTAWKTVLTTCNGTNNSSCSISLVNGCLGFIQSWSSGYKSRLSFRWTGVRIPE